MSDNRSLWDSYQKKSRAFYEFSNSSSDKGVCFIRVFKCKIVHYKWTLSSIMSDNRSLWDSYQKKSRAFYEFSNRSSDKGVCFIRVFKCNKYKEKFVILQSIGII